MTDLPTLDGTSGWITIWNDIKNGGLPLIIFFILFVVWTSRIYISDFVSALFKLFKNKTLGKEIRHYTKKEVVNHPIFKDLEFWITVGISSMRMNTIVSTLPTASQHIETLEYLKAKEEIAKDLLNIKFKSIQKCLKDFINDHDLSTLTTELLKQYIQSALKMCKGTQQKEMQEMGIPDKFLIKYIVYERVADEVLQSTINILLSDDNFNIDIYTRTYLLFNVLDNYLTDVFNNIIHTVESINGDLNGIEYKGNTIGVKRTSILKPPHPSFVMPVKEILIEVMSKFGASRAYMVRYYLNSHNIGTFSCVYEVLAKGVTSELSNIQEYPMNNEYDVISILKRGQNIVSEISQFNAYTVEGLSERGIHGIIMSPVFENDKLIGALVLDYLSVEDFNANKDMDKIDEKLNRYVTLLQPYICYPVDYIF